MLALQTKPKRRLLIALLSVLIALVLLHVLGQCSRFLFGHGHVFGLIDLFQLDYENTPASYFSGLQFVLAAGLMGLFAIRLRGVGGRRSWYWFGLALVFVYLAADEVIQIHEHFGKTLFSEQFRDRVVFPMWTAVAGVLVLITVLVFARFWWTMTPKLRWQLAAAAAVFLAGAVGVEVLSYYYRDVYTHRNLGYNLLVAIEEGLEMLGVLLVIRTLLIHLPPAEPRTADVPEQSVKPARPAVRA